MTHSKLQSPTSCIFLFSNFQSHSERFYKANIVIIIPEKVIIEYQLTKVHLFFLFCRVFQEENSGLVLIQKCSLEHTKLLYTSLSIITKCTQMTLLNTIRDCLPEGLEMAVLTGISIQYTCECEEQQPTATINV